MIYYHFDMRIRFALTVMFAIGGVVMTSDAVQLKKATFAGGCFWCMQPHFDALEGVRNTVVGYTGGKTDNPTYEEISTGKTGHYEAIEMDYDPAKVTYETLIETFWRTIDPTQADGQFADRGSQYMTAIFFHDESQKTAAEKAKKELGASGLFDKPIATKILPAAKFWPAEEYHQKYYQKKTFHYKMYSKGSGREGFIEKVWGTKNERK